MEWGSLSSCEGKAATMAPTAGRCRRAIELRRRWQAAQSGALPFVLLLFGILSMCPYFFTTFTLENAVWHAARAIRTGQVQQSQGDYTATVDRRVTQVASSTADLVARAEKQISHSEIGDIMKVGGYILEPYSQSPLEITLRNVTSSPANATTTKQSWSCTYKGLDKTQTCACSNTIKSIPPTCSPATTASWSPRSAMATSH